jgi:hypothetical protein
MHEMQFFLRLYASANSQIVSPIYGLKKRMRKERIFMKRFAANKLDRFRKKYTSPITKLMIQIRARD